ncbi:o-succinylbenzoate--CoA ligase [Enterobacter mori]|uniref:o-succinylbenzoate--CoA ligase n=1 Tax=Enterobacter mori TaxID=539813 RepID=UPI0032AF1897
MSFTDWPWRHWCTQRVEKPALRLDDDVLTWQQLCARIDSLATGFHRQGVQEGDGVMLLAHNHPQTLLAWLALLQCGARILPVNPQLPRPLLDVLLPQMTLRHALVLDGAFDRLSALSLSEHAGEYAVAWQPDRLASMTLTSGSTGLPKAAVHTCAAHLASAQGVLALMPYGGDDDWLLSLPLFHVSGQGILWRWLLVGGRLTVRKKQPLEQALEGCTHASLVPTQLWRLLHTQHHVALKAVLLGGAAIPVELTEKAREQGIRTFCGYGLTEFASTVCAKAADGEPDVGTALPGREVKLVEGEIWIKAQSMAAGYWRDGALLPLTNAQGWFATRDRGEWRNGRLTILGRMDNLFFSGGEGIQPESLERVIATHPQISQVFIVPLDDAEFGQRPVAVVECEPGTDIAQFPDWIQGRLARFEQPVHWLVLPAELKNGGIKISRQALKQWVNALLRG